MAMVGESMSDRTNCDLPKIDTSDFELALSDAELMRFYSNRPAFVSLVNQIVIELKLQGHIEHLNICSPAYCRAELYRDHNNPWPSKNLCLDIYTNKYMDERLLRHELGHEADRRNPDMLYDPTIEKRWRGQNFWILEMAANISLDARLGDGGLGKKKRRKEFCQKFGKEYDSFFEEVWANAPTTWPAIEALSSKLSKMLPGNIRGGSSVSGRSKHRVCSSKHEQVEAEEE